MSFYMNICAKQIGQVRLAAHDTPTPTDFNHEM